MIRVDELRFSSRKTLAVCIDVTGRVIVRAPKGYPREKIETFLSQKEDWIVRHQKVRRENGICLPERLDGYALPFLGGELRLCVSDVKRVFLGEQTLYLPARDAEKKLVAWLKTQALALLEERTAFWAGKMGVVYRTVKVSSAKRKWGSCSASDEIRYAYRLIYAPTEMIDYVVVHELSHVCHKNHSPRFWVEVAAYLPDWKRRRAWLKAHAALLEIF